MLLDQLIFSLNHRDFLTDCLMVEQRMAQHILQARQSVSQLRWRNLKKPGAAPGQRGGVDLPALGLNPAHQPALIRPAAAAGEQQMLQQGRQPRPAVRLIMAAGADLN